MCFVFSRNSKLIKGTMDSTKPPEFEPPQACVNRVIKSVLPESVQVTKEARVF